MQFTGDRRNTTSKSAIGLSVGLAALLGSGRAFAQSTTNPPEGFVLASDIEGVKEIVTHSDGRVTLIFEDGRELVISADDVLLNGTNIFVELDALNESGFFASIADLPTPVIVTGALLGGVGIVALVTDDDDGPTNRAPVFTGSDSASVAENTNSSVFTASATDEDNDGLTFSIAGGPDAALFEIDSTTGSVSFRTAPDFEAPGDADSDNTYALTVSVTDGTEVVTRDITISVTNENDVAPVFDSATTGSIDENATGTGYTASATDVEGDAVSFAIVGGADAALFLVDAATGVVSLVAPQDFEAPGDSNADGIYEVTLQASDGINATTQTVRFTLNNLNDTAPVISSPASISLSENTSAIVYDVEASDADGDVLTFSVTGADAALFSIDASTGELRFNSAPDFETPSDSDQNNVFDVTVIASDGVNSDQQAVQITVTNENDNAPSFSSGSSASLAENDTAIAYTANAQDQDGDAITYAIAGGADASRFSIDANTGALSFLTPPDFEAPGDADSDNTYDVVLEASDGTNTTTQAVSIAVTNINDNAPAFSSSPTRSVDENRLPVGQVVASDLDGDQITYAIIFGADQGQFTIDPATGELFFVSAPDFESPSDQNADNTYELIVRASDGTNTVDQSILVDVTNANDNAPTITTNTTAFSTAEGTVGVLGTVAASDADGSPLNWSISGGADAAAFSIDPDTGELSIVAALDFETPSDADSNNVYAFGVTVSDGIQSDTVTFNMTVTNINDVAPVFSSGVSTTQQENTTSTGYTAAASDTVEGDPVSYTIAPGGDGALFSIDAVSGVLRFIAAPDFEAPGDADLDNIYDVTVRASDGVNSTDQTIRVAVTDIVNEQSPVFTSASLVAVDENALGAAYTATATDPQNDTLSYSITGGADAALFTINGASGDVTFLTAPDFEAPGDANVDNTYDIEITVSDGTNQTVQTVQIQVDNLNDNAPNFTSGASQTVPENQSGVAFTALATDADGNALTYAIIGGADATRFAIDTANGQVSFVSPPDFESPDDAGADNTYDLVIEASDGTNATQQTLAISVTNENDNAPEITFSAAQAIDENSTATIVTATASDADSSPLTWAITGGIDGGLFAIDANSGALRFINPQNFEVPTDADQGNTYDVEVTVSDGDFSDSRLVTVTLNDVNEAPVFNFASPIAFNTAENTIDTGFDPNAATDPDGDALGYTLSGPDGALFQIGSSGRIEFVSPADFETPNDANTDGVYEVTITASDGALTDTLDLQITVTDANDAPDVTSAANQSVAENTATVYTATASDPDAGSPTLTFAISGGADAGLFSINTSTGEVSFNTAPDFESPGDSGADNVYDIEITASDGIATSAAQSVSISVTNVNDVAPVFSSATSASVAENEVNTGYTAMAADLVEGDVVTYAIAGGADGVLFSINSNTGALSFVAPQDFESPADANTDNVYELIIRASDGLNETDQAVQVTVTDVAQEGQPVITSTNTVSVAETNIAGTVFQVTATDPQNDPLTYALSGTDASLFTIQTNGQIGNLGVLDFEAPSDANADGIYTFNIEVFDGTSTTVQAFTLVLTDVNDTAPTLSQTPSLTLDENALTVNGQSANAASDPDTVGVLTYSLSGTDSALFTIDGNTGLISKLTASDFESPDDSGADGTYDLILEVSDGTFQDTQAITVSLVDLNEAPELTSSPNQSVGENTMVAFTATAVDPDSGSPALSFSITGGADAAQFSIDASSGVVSFLGAPDFEVPTDSNSDNIYDVEVSASDGSLSASQLVSVAVSNANDNAPAFGTPSTFIIAENATTVQNQLLNPASDADGDLLSYTLSGADAALFTVDSTTGELFKTAAPDFESPDDANSDGIYELTLTATDGLNSTSANLQGLIQNVLEAPVFTSGSTGSLDENSTAVAYTASAGSQDGFAITYSISGGADAALFSIDSTTGDVTPNAAFDHEMPGDNDTDNVFDLTIEATGGTAATTTSQSVSITLNDVNDNPTSVSPSTNNVSFDENQSGVVFTPNTPTDADADAVIRFGPPFGADASFFSVDPITGQLSLTSGLNFENPQDDNTDNVYQVFYTVFDDRPGSSGSSTILVNVTINDVNETVMSAPQTVLESFVDLSDPDDEDVGSLSEIGDKNFRADTPIVEAGDASIEPLDITPILSEDSYVGWG